MEQLNEAGSSNGLEGAGPGGGVIVGGKKDVLIHFCRSCNALFGEDIAGVITRGKGITVHRVDCGRLLQSDSQRRVGVTWDTQSPLQDRTVPVDVECEDAPGMLAAMSKAIGKAGVNIGGVVLKKLPEVSSSACVHAWQDVDMITPCICVRYR